jgi:hypothetical protein
LLNDAEVQFPRITPALNSMYSTDEELFEGGEPDSQSENPGPLRVFAPRSEIISANIAPFASRSFALQI